MCYVAVEMATQFPEHVYYYPVSLYDDGDSIWRADCLTLSFHGDVVYIGGDKCVVHWNVVTNVVQRLEGYPGLIVCHCCTACLCFIWV